MLTSPFCMVELRRVLAVLPESMIEDVEGKICPLLLFMIDFEVFLAPKLIQYRKLPLEGGIRFFGWEVWRFGRRGRRSPG
jgi:hypothetical protein